MSERTAIEWTEKTWNPWQGCTKVSPGCAHCYMYREKMRYGQDPETVIRSKPLTFNAPLKWPAPALVFTCSWSDFFHEAADAWRPLAWDIIRSTPHLTYQILTKRPERIAAQLPQGWGAGWRNVWLGTSVESQRWTPRLGDLLLVPAVVHFLSAEPLLGPLDLAGYTDGSWIDEEGNSWGEHALDWVIVGGESGPRARPMDLAWVRALRDECAQEGVAFFLKQLGGTTNKRGGDEALLDGVRHTAMPSMVTARGEA